MEKNKDIGGVTAKEVDKLIKELIKNGINATGREINTERVADGFTITITINVKD